VHDHAANTLRVRHLGIDTYQEPVVFMAADCPVCRSEGWEAQARVKVSREGRSLIATLNVITGSLLAPDEVSLSDAAWRILGAKEGDWVFVSHPPPVTSFGLVRGKLYGQRLGAVEFSRIVEDLVTSRYSTIEVTAFVAACAAGRLDRAETVALTRAMLDAGERLVWPHSVVVDKHSVGGLPGNRTTMVVVPVVAASGLIIPKTSSRAITSPAGTADAMETVAPVDLDVSRMRSVVEREGGCVVWGGGVRLSPADEVIIRVERPLDIDSEGQMVASVLSKKAAAGSTHVVVDMPVGPTAKVRSRESAQTLSELLRSVGEELGLTVEVAVGDGTQPIGRGIGPALEARDVLSVLRRDPEAPRDLLERSLDLAGRLIGIGREIEVEQGTRIAREILEDGRALRKFEAICQAQGGMREPTIGAHTHTVEATEPGIVVSMDNRRLARAAKLAGAPADPGAGLDLFVRLGDTIEVGQPLFTLYAESPGELDYALSFISQQDSLVMVETPQT
jgi:thymidine phosphorylase